jgi:hypothetical protein
VGNSLKKSVDFGKVGMFIILVIAELIDLFASEEETSSFHLFEGLLPGATRSCLV